MSRALPRLAAVVLMVIPFAHFAARPVDAQVLASHTALFTVASGPAAPAGALLFPVSTKPALADSAVAPGAPDFSRIRRPAALPALYAATIVTQVLDAHSTMTALNRGAREVNPVMQGPASNNGALLAVKVGAAVGTIVIAEKMWRRNRTAAVAMMLAVNAVTIAVAAHNYSVASSLR